MLSNAFEAVVRWIRQESAAFQALVQAFIALGIAFGWWSWTSSQTGAVVGITAALLAMFVRSQVTPLIRPVTSDNRPLIPDPSTGPGGFPVNPFRGRRPGMARPPAGRRYSPPPPPPPPPPPSGYQPPAPEPSGFATRPPAPRRGPEPAGYAPPPPEPEAAGPEQESQWEQEPEPEAEREPQWEQEPAPEPERQPQWEPAAEPEREPQWQPAAEPEADLDSGEYVRLLPPDRGDAGSPAEDSADETIVADIFEDEDDDGERWTNPPDL